MSKTTEADYIFSPERFTGEIAVGEECVPVSLVAGAGPSGRLDLEVDPISRSSSSRGVSALMRSFGRPGNSIDEFSLACETLDGKRLTSDRAYIAGYNHNSEGLYIRLHTSEARLTMAAQETQDRPALRFWLLGFECFPSVQVATELGSIVVRGATRRSARDEITGSIAVQAPGDSEPTTWREPAGHLLKHLRSVLAFARGAPLPVPVTEFYEGDRVEAIFHETAGGYASEMPPLLHLNLEPIVKTAAASLEYVEPYRETFETAIGWLLVPTTYDEVRFLTGMTALESLASRSLEKPQISILGSAASKRFAKRVRALVDERDEFDDSVKDAIKRKIPELNRHSFTDKLGALLDRWHVARTSIDDSELDRLVRLRNSIVHEGSALEEEELWPSILFVREILVRLVLAMLQFNGSYQCYIGGRHTRRFPDCEPTG